MQELPIAANESFSQRPDLPHRLSRKSITVLLPVLTVAIIIGSLFGLQWVSQRALALGYPVPQVQIHVSSTGSLVLHQSYQFSAAGTGRDLTYIWDFGDQSGGYGPSASHVYEQNGSFTVTLTVTDPAGQSGTQTQAVTVVPPPPQATFTFSASSYSKYVYFDASYSTADSSTSISSYNWTFGDGTTDNTYYPQYAHYYSASGTYQVTLVVTDATGQSSVPYSTSVVVS